MSTRISLQKTQILLHLSRHLAADMELTVIGRVFLDDLQQLIPARRLLLYSYSQGAASLKPLAILEADLSELAREAAGDFQQAEIALTDEVSPVAKALAARQPLFQFSEPAGGQPVAAVPLIAKEQCYGVVLMDYEGGLSHEERILLEHACQIAAIALENHQLQARPTDTNYAMDKSRAAFLSMMAHELRSPLNAINGYLDLTLQGVAGELNVQQQEFLQRARSGSENLYGLLEDLLLIARVDEGQFRLSNEIVHLQEMLPDAVEDMEVVAKDNQVSVEIELDANFPPIYADGVRLRQVVRNLLSNGLRFTPTGGTVNIEARLISLSFEGEAEGARWLRLEVRDSGKGIAPKNLPHIFERFYQVIDGNTSRSGGLGLGLTAVKLIVEEHGGSVTVESQPGQGTAVICLLPGVLS